MSLLSTILIVDDHQIVFSGIKLILHSKQKKYKLDNCINGNDCIDIIRKTAFDLIILDVNLPDTDTYQLIHLIFNLNPKQKVLMFSMSSEEMYAKRFLQLGALGFVSKQASNEDFVMAVEKTLKGERYLSPTMIEAMTNDALNGESGNVFEKLSKREFEIMTYFLNGYGSKEVANITNLHSSTIGTYKFKIFDKLAIKNILELHELAKIHNITSKT